MRRDREARFESQTRHVLRGSPPVATRITRPNHYARIIRRFLDPIGAALRPNQDMNSLTCGRDFERFQQGSANDEIGISIISLRRINTAGPRAVLERGVRSRSPERVRADFQPRDVAERRRVRFRMVERAWEAPDGHVPVPGMKHPMRHWPSSCHSHTMAWPILFCCRTIAWAGTGSQRPSIRTR